MVGFEPTSPFGLLFFENSAFSLSATLPRAPRTGNNYRTTLGRDECSCDIPNPAEHTGFEPVVDFSTQPFQDCTISHSVNVPNAEV
jgi:hypothetical protein